LRPARGTGTPTPVESAREINGLQATNGLGAREAIPNEINDLAFVSRFVSLARKRLILLV
jgi:hypothetical protein